MENNNISFIDILKKVYLSKENFTITIDDVNSKAELLKAYNNGFELPPYFGFNWDALNDCLLDLSWIPQREIVIYHPNIPLLTNQDLAIYLDILSTAISTWNTHSEVHTMRVYFNEKDKEYINNHIHSD